MTTAKCRFTSKANTLTIVIVKKKVPKSFVSALISINSRLAMRLWSLLLFSSFQQDSNVQGQNAVQSIFGDTVEDLGKSEIHCCSFIDVDSCVDRSFDTFKIFLRRYSFSRQSGQDQFIFAIFS